MRHGVPRRGAVGVQRADAPVAAAHGRARRQERSPGALPRRSTAAVSAAPAAPWNLHRRGGRADCAGQRHPQRHVRGCLRRVVDCVRRGLRARAADADRAARSGAGAGSDAAGVSRHDAGAAAGDVHDDSGVRTPPGTRRGQRRQRWGIRGCDSGCRHRIRRRRRHLGRGGAGAASVAGRLHRNGRARSDDAAARYRGCPGRYVPVGSARALPRGTVFTHAGVSRQSRQHPGHRLREGHGGASTRCRTAADDADAIGVLCAGKQTRCPSC